MKFTKNALEIAPGDMIMHIKGKRAGRAFTAYVYEDPENDELSDEVLYRVNFSELFLVLSIKKNYFHVSCSKFTGWMWHDTNIMKFRDKYEKVISS